MLKYFQEHDPMPVFVWIIVICISVGFVSCTVKNVVLDIRAIQTGVAN